MRIAYYIITLAAIAVVCLLSYQQKLELKDLGTACLGLFGTFLGATIAFRLNEQKDKSELQAKQRAALNRALFVLVRQQNAMIQLKKEFESFKDDFAAAFNMPSMKPPEYVDLKQDFGSLEFLLQSKAPNTLFKLTIEQERFEQAIDSLRLRNEFYVNEVQHAISDASLNKKVVTPAEVEALFGQRLYGGAINLARTAREHIYATYESIPEMLGELRELAKDLFPKHKFIKYEPPGNSKAA